MKNAGNRRLLAAGLSVIIALGVLAPTSVLAECTGQTNAFPPLAAVAPSADVVVVGTVERMDGASGGPLFTAFWLRVDEALLGDPGERLEINTVKSGLPLRGSAACRHNAVLYARVGDVLAIALDGTYDGYRHVNSLAWIGKRPNDLTRAETLTLAEARRSVIDLPDTSTTSSTSFLDGVERALRAVAEWLAGTLSISTSEPGAPVTE